ncbi:hypothetical protein [Nitratidesulfovibrio vulgaris]|uniref:hypothetical protein n=1 Tax=Nitratidesulfovibrio vulgaris TaxID=881 RepID=UPI0023012B11|nr:hypothetical protein [Nitratidesulfovibrio vulgaris]WCB45065.1 hypothetical protein PH214_08140 [Nitratidesulfovibrio vulgaris]
MSKKFHITQDDIQDVLLARGKKANATALINIAKDKNILLSHEDSRETLALYVSKLPFDYHDIAKLYDMIEQDQRREKTTSQKIKSRLSDQDLRSAVGKHISNNTQTKDTLNIVSKPDATTFVLEIEYDEDDFSKARMLQTIRKKSRIEVCLNDNSALVRHQANEKCEQIVASILSLIKEQKKEPIEIEKIELSNIASADRRNTFFEHLLKKCDGLVGQNVISVRISRMQIDDAEDSDAEQESDEAVPAPCFIKKVVLEGESLLAQEEYLNFIEKGFYISSIAWQAIDNKSSTMVELEAGFANPSECKDFKYDVKGIYTIEKESGMPSQTKKAASHIDRLKYLDVIEKAATESMREVSNDKV